MTVEQTTIIAILTATVAMFLWGRWRHDMVALAALVACVIAGLVPGDEAFAGFGHPAVITVASILILSSGLQESGAVDLLARRALPASAGPRTVVTLITSLAALLSAFMNNVGALALLMPLAIQTARRLDMPPGRILMPVSFGSILGGLTTLIGTPPNLIVSGFRAQATGDGFGMFAFTPVGAVVAAAGVTFVILVGWRLVPIRRKSGAESFDIGAYLTEARVSDSGKAVGMRLGDVETALHDADAQIVGLVRNEVRISAPSRLRVVQPGDILLIEADPEALARVLSSLDLKLEESVKKEDKPEAEPEKDDTDSSEKTAQPERVVLMELAVLPNSSLAGRSASDIRLRTRYSINLLAVSRQGQREMKRLRTMEIREGDVLLMQGTPEVLADFANQFGCVPLAERPLRLPDKGQAARAVLIMAAAVTVTSAGLLPAAVAFVSAVLAAMVFGVVRPRTMYSAIDWPVIVLLGALIPVAGAMASTGAADFLAQGMVNTVAQGRPVIVLAILLILTMTLSDFMNNAATAAVMCPIAIGTAAQLQVSADPFLMAVAVGASCAFLTPIGHQNNTLILGPAGFRFGDYWRMGLPVEVIVVAVGIPMILFIWPL